MPRDIIAVLILIILFILKVLGMNGTIDMLLVMVVTYYFSKRVYEETNEKW